MGTRHCSGNAPSAQQHKHIPAKQAMHPVFDDDLAGACWLQRKRNIVHTRSPRGLGRETIRTHKQSGAELAPDIPAEVAEGNPGTTAVVAGRIEVSPTYFFSKARCKPLTWG